MERLNIWWNQMIENEIEEVKGAIRNEHVVELGYRPDEENLHSENIAVMRSYINMLEEARR